MTRLKECSFFDELVILGDENVHLFRRMVAALATEYVGVRICGVAFLND